MRAICLAHAVTLVGENAQGKVRVLPSQYSLQAEVTHTSPYVRKGPFDHWSLDRRSTGWIQRQCPLMACHLIHVSSVSQILVGLEGLEGEEVQEGPSPHVARLLQEAYGDGR